MSTDNMTKTSPSLKSQGTLNLGKLNLSFVRNSETEIKIKNAYFVISEREYIVS